MTNQKSTKAPTGDDGQNGDNTYDDMDCRPESTYPKANFDAATPDYIKDMLAKTKRPEGTQPEDRTSQDEPQTT